MIRLPLHIAFKGNRDYLQGPDLLRGLLQALDGIGAGVDGDLDVTFYKKTGYQPDIGVLQAGDPSARSADAIGCWSSRCGADRLRGWYLQSARPVETREPYDEDLIATKCAMGEDRIAFHGEAAVTAGELCVAMAKALHIARFPISADKHWVVCRFALNRPLDEADKTDMTVVIETKLGGHLTKSGLFTGADRLGAIFFSPALR